MLRSMRLTRYPLASFVGRIWELRHYLTACEAAYAALTEAF
jgi:predicted nucleic acid-binding protein